MIHKIRSQKILVVDEQSIQLQSTVSFLERLLPQCKISGTWSGREALEWVRQNPPDLVMTDVTLREISYVDLLNTANLLHVPTIVLTSLSGTPLILNLISYRVRGIIHRSDDLKTLSDCLEHVFKGKKYFNRLATNILNEKWRVTHQPVRISPRGLDVIRLMIKGQTSKEIARNLSLTEKTVNSYRGELLEATSTKSASELTAFAFENGYI